MKPFVVVALVVVVLFTGVPVVMGMPMATCADCDLGLLAATTCVLAVLTGAAALVAAQLHVLLHRRHHPFAARLVAGRLERPPRLA